MDHKEVENFINTKLNEFTLQLSEHLLQTIQGSVKITVKEAVNGKIDKIQKDLTGYLDEDRAWKEKVEPLIEIYQNATNLQKVAISIAKTILTLTAGATALWAFFKFVVIAAIR